jgi:hypothetical protein
MPRYRIMLGSLKYTYFVGNYTIAILPPSKKKHLAQFAAVANKELSSNRSQNGTADGRISPEEVAAYILKQNLR